MIAEIKEQLTMFTPGQIRKNKMLKADLGVQAEGLAVRMEQMMGALPS